MVESKGALLYKLWFSFIGILIIGCMILLTSKDSTRPPAPVANVSYNPNAVDRAMSAAANDTGHFFALTGYTLSNSTRTVAVAAVHSIIHADETIQTSMAFLIHGVIGSLAFMTHSVGHIFNILPNPLDLNAVIKPASSMHVPVIIPLPASLANATAATPVKANLAAPQPQSTPQTPVVKAAAVTFPAQIPTVNSYAWGNCTRWAATRRSQINDPIPNTWGNAATWAERAMQGGYKVDHNPSPGAIMQISNVDGGLGHVAFVESVDQNGTWHISEMNVLGLNIVDDKAEPSSAAINYNFIHDRN